VPSSVIPARLESSGLTTLDSRICGNDGGLCAKPQTIDGKTYAAVANPMLRSVNRQSTPLFRGNDGGLCAKPQTIDGKSEAAVAKPALRSVNRRRPRNRVISPDGDLVHGRCHSRLRLWNHTAWGSQAHIATTPGWLRTRGHNGRARDAVPEPPRHLDEKFHSSQSGPGGLTNRCKACGLSGASVRREMYPASYKAGTADLRNTWNLRGVRTGDLYFIARESFAGRHRRPNGLTENKPASSGFSMPWDRARTTGPCNLKSDP
jgi:hypothetical protein